VIESIGYTEDGFIWIKVIFEFEKKPASMIVMLSPDKAMEVSKILAAASTEAKEKCGVRNSTNTH
jgi:hypothetical protein